MHSRDWFLVFIGFFLPPIPVAVKRGILSLDFLLNILLCLLGYFPGLLHSYYIISVYPYREDYISIVESSEDRGNYGSTSV